MPARSLHRDALVALLLAALLGAAWAWADRGALVQLRLPDTDDAVRLQQIRDWLAGQAFADLRQHRLAGGLAMHWSRLADLGPAALIATLAPLLGPHAAEVAAVTLWPPILFAGALFLVARIARAVDVEPVTAAVIAAVAFPATTLFLPGRIDHHNLQMLFLLGAALAGVRAPSGGAGVAAGLLAAASLTVGLEAAPMVAGLGAVAVAEWIAAREGARERLQGLGVGALVGLAAAKGIFATSDWSYPACDGFTGQAWRAAVLVAPVPLVLALLDDRLTGRRARAGAATGVAAVAAGAALWLSPSCLSPYGQVDPVMARLWLSQVGEAQPLFAASPATALGYAGLAIVGLVCTGFQLRRTRAWGWAVLFAVQLAAAAVTLTALRGAYAGALLAAPALAAAVADARRLGALRLAGAWAASAGMLYPLAADALTPVQAERAVARGDCASPAMAAALDALPPGTVMAPVDAGAYLLAATRQRLIAAPYHRNGAGNRASYGFYGGDPAAAEAIAWRWRVSYALSCAAMPGPAHVLAGWARLRTLDDGAVIYAPPLSPVAARR